MILAYIILPILVWYYWPRRASFGIDHEECVVITGGSGDLGQAIVRVLLKRPLVSIIILDKNSSFDFQNDRITCYTCDVGDNAAVKALKDILQKATVLINNAATLTGQSILDVSMEDLRSSFDSNLLAHFHTIQACVPAMVERKSGTFVTVSSVVGLIGAKKLSDYCASKAALLSLHDSLRFELKGSGINCVLLVPGLINTKLFAHTDHTQTSPLGRLMCFLTPILQPKDVAEQLLRALDAKSDQTIFTAFYTRFVPLLRTLPTPVQDALYALMGSNRFMDTYEREQ